MSTSQCGKICKTPSKCICKERGCGFYCRCSIAAVLEMLCFIVKDCADLLFNVRCFTLCELGLPMLLFLACLCHRSARLHHQSVTTISITWVLIHVTCTSLITQSTQHYKSTHPTPALCPISIIRSGLSTATRYDLLDTYLFRNLPPVPPPRGFLCLPRLSPLVL